MDASVTFDTFTLFDRIWSDFFSQILTQNLVRKAMGNWAHPPPNPIYEHSVKEIQVVPRNHHKDIVYSKNSPICSDGKWIELN